MKKLQIYLPENVYSEFNILAAQEQVSVPILIRQILIKAQGGKRNQGLKALRKISKYDLKGESNLAQNIDKTIYR